MQETDEFSYTYKHCGKVCKYSIALAKEIGLKGKELKDIEKASFLHDIGKIGIPHYILHKPEKLTREEFEIIKAHPVIGFEILEKAELKSSLYLRFILHHHERYDGKGYPAGLKGEEIPLGARIISIADSFEAMTAERPYKKAMRIEEALEELRENAGTQFDPDLVEKFIHNL